jgi:hypothetical protein
MAGGPYAAAAACDRCEGRAERVYEGSETDWYACGRCGHKFGIEFESCGPPPEPLWPRRSRPGVIARLADHMNRPAEGLAAETAPRDLPHFRRLPFVVAAVSREYGAPAQAEWIDLPTLGDLADAILARAREADGRGAPSSAVLSPRERLLEKFTELAGLPAGRSFAADTPVDDVTVVHRLLPCLFADAATFGLKLSWDDLEGVTTVGQLADLVLARAPLRPVR